MKHIRPSEFSKRQLALPFDLPPEWITAAPKGFWEKADIRGADECWIWQGAINSSGYGAFTHGAMAHLIAFRIAHGEMPDGMECGHECHTPACINPHHHKPVTRQQNAAAAGERRRGKPLKVLTEAIVITARKLRRAGWKMKDIAAKFKVVANTISRAIRGVTWGWVDAEPAVA